MMRPARLGPSPLPSLVVVLTANNNSAPESSDRQGRVDCNSSEPHEEDKQSVRAVVCVMLGSPHTASFFAAVGLSEMVGGITDTFLFIRYVLVSTSMSLGYDYIILLMHARTA